MTRLYADGKVIATVPDEDDYDPSEYGDGTDYEPNYESWEDEEEMPEGCRACGGPWPECKISCSLYDD